MSAPQVLNPFYGAPQPRSPLSALDANRLVVGGPPARRTPGTVRTTPPPPQRSAAVQAGSGGLRACTQMGVRLHAATSPVDWSAGGAGAPQPAAEGDAGARGAGSWAAAAGRGMAAARKRYGATAAPAASSPLQQQQQGGGAAQPAGGAAAGTADGEAPRSQRPLPWPASACNEMSGVAGMRQLEGDVVPCSASAREPDLAPRVHGAGAAAAVDAAFASVFAAPGAEQGGVRTWQHAGLLTAQLTAIAAAAAAAATAAVHGRQRAEQDAAPRAASPPAVGARSPAHSVPGKGGESTGTGGGAAGAGRVGYDPAAYSSRDGADGAGPSAGSRPAVPAQVSRSGSAAAAGAAQATASVHADAAAASAALVADLNPQVDPCPVLPAGWFPAVFLPPPPGLWGYGVPGVGPVADTAARTSAAGIAAFAEAAPGPVPTVPGPSGLRIPAGAAKDAGPVMERAARHSNHAAEAAPSATDAHDGQVSMPVNECALSDADGLLNQVMLVLV